MNIAYVTLQYPAPSETFACSDVQALIRQGHKVEVFTLKPPHKNFSSMLIDRGLDKSTIHTCSKKEILKGIFIIISSPLLFLKTISVLVKYDIKKPYHLLKMFLLLPSSFYIYNIILEKKPDVIHLFWGHYPSIVGYLLKKTNNNLKVTMFLGAYDLELNLGISRYFGKVCDGVFSHSNSNRNDLIELGINHSKINIIHRGIDVVALGNVIKDLKLSGNPKIAILSRLVIEKGIREAIEVIEILKEKYPKIKLYIAGDGPYKRMLIRQINQKRINENVELLGHLSHKNAIKILAATDFFILPTKHKGERLPNAIKEAMYCGCIPITTKSKGIDELIINNSDGFIMEFNNPVCFAEKILELMQKPNILFKIKSNAIAKIIKNFNIEIQMKKYSTFWETISK